MCCRRRLKRIDASRVGREHLPETLFGGGLSHAAAAELIILVFASVGHF